jgi:hypothetical protein
MMTTTEPREIRSRPWVYGLIYMGLSMAIEIMLLVVFRLQIPRDNAIIAPILLVASPLLAAWICGYRRPQHLLPLAAVTVLLTLILVMGFGRTTGILAPVIIRTVAGFVAAWGLKRVGKG